MIDITSMVESFAKSVPDLEKLGSGIGYVMGIYFIFHALGELHDLVDKHTKHNVKGGILAPVAYFLCGAALLYLPSTVDVFKTTLFGTSSPLAYDNSTELSEDTIQAVMDIVEMVGVFWVVRGFALLAYSSDPHVQHGMRAYVFIIGGIFCMNITYTGDFLKNTGQSIVTGVLKLYPVEQKDNSSP